MRVTELPMIERPRERLVRYGPGRLSNTELLAILLGTGLPGKNALELSRHLLLRFGGQRLTTATVVELERHLGLGPGKSASLVASFELGRRLLREESTTVLFTARDVWLSLAPIRPHKKEYFVVFYLDSRHRVLAQETISVGTVDASLVHPREVFEPAIKHLASQIILAHNHPSGQLEPSTEDLLVTDRLARAGQLLGIEVLDHVIVSEANYLSLKESGLF